MLLGLQNLVSTTNQAPPAREAAHSREWAVLFWTAGLAALAIVSQFQASALSFSLLLLVFPDRIGVLRRLGLLALAVFSSSVGIGLLPIIIALAGMLLRSSVGIISIIRSVALTSLAPLLTPLISNLGDETLWGVSHQSILVWVAPALAGLLAIASREAMASAIKVLVLTAVLVSLLCVASLGGLEASFYTHALFHPCFALLCLSPIVLDHRRPREPSQDALSRTTGLMVGITSLLLTIFLYLADDTARIQAVLFDEAHGKWETTTLAFTDDSFGRESLYNYRLLYEHVRKNTGNVGVVEEEAAELPEGGLLVLKMPVTPYSAEFIEKVWSWINVGGNVLIIADHTNLFNTTTHLNEFLAYRTTIRIAETATFDQAGMPIREISTGFMSLRPVMFDSQSKIKWQTGTSLSSAEFGLIPLDFGGLAFREPADYSRQNRFGIFRPKIDLPYVPTPNIFTKIYGSGSLTLLMDSTPWSNFSFHEHQFKLLASQVVKTAELRGLIATYSKIIVLTIFFLALGLLNNKKFLQYLLIGSTTALLALGILINLSIPRHLAAHDLSFGVEIFNNAKSEYLKQLLQPNESNYAKLLTVFSKYGESPTLSPPKSTLRGLFGTDKAVLLIEPESKDLPSAAQVRAHLRAGGELWLFMDERYAIEKSFIAWLQELGLVLHKRSSIGLMSDSNPDLLSRELPHLRKTVVPITRARQDSLLQEDISNDLFQTYHLVDESKKKGRLVLSLVAREFSDVSLGEIWDGQRPSSIAFLRDRQLRAVIKREPALPDNTPLRPAIEEMSDIARQAKTLKILVVKDGQVAYNDSVEITSRTDAHLPSPAVNLPGYLGGLYVSAERHVQKFCPPTSMKAQEYDCPSRLLLNDGVEWVVHVSKGQGSRGVIELLHERRFSGLASTWNILFEIR